MWGSGNIIYAGIPATPLASADANNGLSVDAITGKLVLGNDQSDPLAPAGLLSEREIKSNGFGIELLNAPFSSGGDGLLNVAIDGTGGKNAGVYVNVQSTTVARGLQLTNSSANITAIGAQIDGDGVQGFVGIIGNSAANPASLRNTVLLKSVNATFPHVALMGSDGGTVKHFTAVAGVTTETRRFLLPVSAVLNFGNTLAQTSTDLTVNVPGAADGDAVELGVPNAAANANSCYTAFVSAPNTVTVRFNNYSAAAIDPASATFKIGVIKLLP